MSGDTELSGKSLICLGIPTYVLEFNSYVWVFQHMSGEFILCPRNSSYAQEFFFWEQILIEMGLQDVEMGLQDVHFFKIGYIFISC